MNNGFSGTLTSTATFNNDAQTREIDFIYDHNGMRTTKIVSENGRVETTEYTLHGKFITHMTKRTVDENGTESTEDLHFFYDAQSRPAFVEYDGAMYRYVHNLQGDTVAIVDAAGNLVVEYKYDAWGKTISIAGFLKTTLGELNLFRYRGYVYDEETELYYLRSRYYNPEIQRFKNADSIVCGVHIISRNIYSYCRNNPISFVDRFGRSEDYVYYMEDCNEDNYNVVVVIHVPQNENIGEFEIGHIEFALKDEGIWRTISYGPASLEGLSLTEGSSDARITIRKRSDKWTPGYDITTYYLCYSRPVTSIQNALKRIAEDIIGYECNDYREVLTYDRHEVKDSSVGIYSLVESIGNVCRSYTNRILKTYLQIDILDSYDDSTFFPAGFWAEFSKRFQ